MNTNPLRIIALCEVSLTDSSVRKINVSLDVDYNDSATSIYNAIELNARDQVEMKLIDRKVVDIVTLNVCNLGQIPMPFEQVEVIVPRVPKYTDRYVSPDTCMVCGDPVGHGGLQCPTMTPYS